MNLLGYLHRDAGPVDGRRKRVTLLRAALAVPCAERDRFSPRKAQTLTPDLLRPVREGFLAPQDLPLRKTNDRTGENTTDQIGDPTIDGERKNKDPPAPSRIGQIPKYGLPAANGAAERRLRLAQPQTQDAEILSRPGEAQAITGARHARAAEAKGPTNPNARVRISPPPSLAANQLADARCDGRHRGRPARAQAAAGRYRSLRGGRRLRRQFPDQVRGRIARRLRHQPRSP